MCFQNDYSQVENMSPIFAAIDIVIARISYGKSQSQGLLHGIECTCDRVIK